jgi:polar amino acid transport system substrate-binding protein
MRRLRRCLTSNTDLEGFNKPMQRRVFLGALAAPMVLNPSLAFSRTTLAELKSAGVIRIGLANQPPYSSLSPEGTIGGFVPTLIKQVMEKLGVPKIEASVASYGELVPGLQAGRWQMIGAAFRLSKERCSAVMFTDPIVFDGGAIAFEKSEIPAPPVDIKSLASMDSPVGILQGSYLVRHVVSLGVSQSRIMQFPDNPALIDGLLAKRVRVAVSTHSSLQDLQKQRGRFEIHYPLADDPPVGSAPAFALGDTELHGAFQEVLRAMRASGDIDKLAEKFGFPPPPDALKSISIEDACKRL